MILERHKNLPFISNVKVSMWSGKELAEWIVCEGESNSNFSTTTAPL
uniref:Uncharacterized protein n=1 Tax=Anguilla anguilla TaxID=7936 RepID=A0A0E9QN68_ANGAN